MSTSFITVDSIVSFDKKYLNIRKIKQGPTRSYWFDSFVMLLLFISLQLYRAIYDKSRAWVLVLLGLIWIYPHLKKIFNLIFVDYWGNRINLVNIYGVKILQPDNELETTVVLIMSSGRKKNLVFRNGENQQSEFIEKLENRSSEYKMETDLV